MFEAANCHLDHHYTAVLVQDSAYMVTVPFFCPDTPPLTRNPVFRPNETQIRELFPFFPKP